MGSIVGSAYCVPPPRTIFSIYCCGRIVPNPCNRLHLSPPSPAGRVTSAPAICVPVHTFASTETKKKYQGDNQTLLGWDMLTPNNQPTNRCFCGRNGLVQLLCVGAGLFYGTRTNEASRIGTHQPYHCCRRIERAVDS